MITTTYVPHGDAEKLNKYKMVAVVRSDIKMSKGKIAAQCGHAFVMLTISGAGDKKFIEWAENGMRKVVLKAGSQDDIEKLANLASKANIPNVIVKDAGLTEVEPGTITVLGIGPDTQEAIDIITGNLSIL